MSTKTGSATSMRHNKRYIATHDTSGKSVYAESPDQNFTVIEGVGGMARSFGLEAIPAIMAGDIDIKNYRGSNSTASYTRQEIVTPGTGVNLLVVDLAPGGETGMHRTQSIDFSICVNGEIEHELDSGEKVTLLPGDHIVQRGTMHVWRNASKTEPARFVAVTIAAESFKIPGTGEMLREVHLPKETKL